MLQLWLCGITQTPEEVGRKTLKPLRAELKSLDFTQLIVGSRYPSPAWEVGTFFSVWEVGTLLQSYIDPRVTVEFNLFFLFVLSIIFSTLM